MCMTVMTKVMMKFCVFKVIPFFYWTMAGKPGRQWRSMCRRLVLGTFLTSCTILLYCLSAPQSSSSHRE